MDNLSRNNMETNVLECQDNFKKMFKHFKTKADPPDMSDVLDFHQCKNMDDVISIEVHTLPQDAECVRKKLDLRPTKDWKIYSLSHHPGLFIICHAVTECGALAWISKCLKEFSGEPYKTNLSNLGSLSSKQSWWEEVRHFLSRNEISKRVSQLRWATMGYHHNWDSKEYSESEQSRMPDDIEDLCKLFLLAVGHPQAPGFKAEAAIVNYYPPGSTLSAHTDHSEPYKEAPLLSFSFVQSGVFLIGGIDKTITPTPLFLHHGDIMVMAGNSRLCYHAVPRILTEVEAMGRNNELNAFLSKFGRFLRLSGRHSTVPPCCDSQNAELAVGSEPVILDENLPSDGTIFSHNQEDLEAILNYVKTIRINMNVRQVKASSHS